MCSAPDLPGVEVVDVLEDDDGGITLVLDEEIYLGFLPETPCAPSVQSDTTPAGVRNFHTNNGWRDL